MSCVIVVDRQKIQKTAENRESATPWNRIPPQEYLLIIRLFTNLPLTIEKKYLIV